MKINRTQEALDHALENNADCQLFCQIVHWVLQSPGYASVKTLTDRIKHLEDCEIKLRQERAKQ